MATVGQRCQLCGVSRTLRRLSRGDPKGSRHTESGLRQGQDLRHPCMFQSLPEPHPPSLPGQWEICELEQGLAGGDRPRDGLGLEETGQVLGVSFRKERRLSAGAETGGA